jgi:hypothetical protein
LGRWLRGQAGSKPAVDGFLKNDTVLLAIGEIIGYKLLT